jgi:hypothetical protein
MASPSWIPSKDADFDTFSNNFKSLIVATPTNYGLTTSDGTALSTAWTSFHNAYLIATTGSTRNHGTIQTKNAQKANLRTLMQNYGTTIRANRAVSDELKINLGLHVRDASPTPIPPPSTAPSLLLGNTRPGVQQVRATDESTPNSRAKPNGTAGMLVFRAVETAPVTDPDTCRFLVFAGRTDFTCNYTSADNGKTATYFARWTNAKGEMGPWSQPLTVPIAA